MARYYENKLTGELMTAAEAYAECSLENDFDDYTNVLTEAERFEIFKANYRLICIKD